MAILRPDLVLIFAEYMKARLCLPAASSADAEDKAEREREYAWLNGEREQRVLQHLSENNKSLVAEVCVCGCLRTRAYTLEVIILNNSCLRLLVLLSTIDAVRSC